MSRPRGLSVLRSDGVSKYLLNGQEIENGPPQGDSHSGRVYHKIEPNDPKHFDWRRKLGMALVNEAEDGEIDKEKEYILNDLPQDYILWVHTAATEESSGAPKKKRADAYLYGHPLGNTKRYRSAEEFKPHLIWLAKDKKEDPKDCLCKICKGPSYKGTDAEAMASKPSNPHKQPDLLPSREQLLDSDPRVPYLYRPGELVWFNKGTAWGLAIIFKRQIINSNPNYDLQPLSHPFRQLLSVSKTQEELRPWLAWTLPPTTNPRIANLKYDSVPWERVVNGEFGPGDAEVDGSILAGREINHSYTPFDPLVKKSTIPKEVQYAGMFLGAEKIWIGEAVRLHMPPNPEVLEEIFVMVIESITEDTTSTAKTGPSTTIKGDIYIFLQMYRPLIYGDKKNWPIPNLPARMVADLQWRNENALKREKTLWFEWRLAESGAIRSLSDIKGRWYESRRLLPILRPNDFTDDAVTEGEIEEVGIWMNSTFDTVDGAFSRKSRLEAFGQAVPKDFKISLEPDGFFGGGSLLDTKSS